MTGQPREEPSGIPHSKGTGIARARWRLLKLFRRSQSGATAVEFAFVAMPFLMLLTAIIEIAMMLWTSQVLEEAVSVTSRTLLTGQFRTVYAGTGPANTEAFRQNVCKGAAPLIDCSKLKIDVRSYGSFAGAKTGIDGSSPIQAGKLDTTGFGYTAPGSEQIVVVRAVLEYTLFMTQWSSALANTSNGKRAIVASTTFRTEPFAGT